MTTIFAAIGTGLLVLLAGSVPIGMLRAWNLEAGVALPWSIVPIALYLSAYWRFLAGQWGDPASAAKRRRNLRANALSPRVWAASLAAGLVGFAALVALLVLTARLVELPGAAPIVTPPGMPFATALALIVVGSIVAGVTEEAAFRGYMQGPIERRYGLALAVLVNGVFFGLLHFPTHAGDVLSMLPYYVAVAAVYGGLTWAADSILPALVLHATGDVVVLTRWWLTGRPEWQIGATPPPLVSETGIDAQFLLTTVASLTLVAAAVGACLAVRNLRSKEFAGLTAALPAATVARS
jgi:membrane protease YdiL (CAAX protease family)